MSLYNNLIGANRAYFYGAGVYAYNCAPDLVNNTISRNRSNYMASTSCGAGLYMYGSYTATGRNNIIWDNSAFTSPSIYGSAAFTYSDVEGGLAGTGNINANPLFLNNPPAGYLFISQIAAGQASNSPCLNAGTGAMVTGSTRTDMIQDAGVVDMGYHWTYQFGGPLIDEFTWDDSEFDEALPELVPQAYGLRISNHPNPFNPTTTISLMVEQTASVELTVTDVAGKTVATLFQGQLETGAHEFLFSGVTLPSGVYVYHANVGGKVATGKALLVK